LALARILERHWELAVDLLVHGAGHQHAAWVRERLEAGGDVDAVSVDPRVVVDDIAEADADAKAHASMLGHGLVARGHHGLDLDRTFDGTDDAGEFGEDAVAGGVDDRPPCRAISGRTAPSCALSSRTVAASSSCMSRL
jgi:hypothetical protein